MLKKKHLRRRNNESDTHIYTQTSEHEEWGDLNKTKITIFFRVLIAL